MSNPKDNEIFEHIDATLREYDHQRALEEANLADLQVFVKAGELTSEQAERRHRAWLIGRVITPNTISNL